MPSAVDQVDDELNDIITNLYSLMVQSHSYAGTQTAQAMTNEVKRLITNLVAFNSTASRLPIAVPPEIIDYVEHGRNPDIYTREFVELVQRQNQNLKGKSEAFGQFRDVLAKEISNAMPELETQVHNVTGNTSRG